ncbi:MAG TPA: UDP-N-acetylmuramoyl-tripeptide--D-alanyl-D-alanine ligase [Vicinamibacterales bacterium]|nr:UDP-N-acetylmuramoyl-tripeptide--D-alanyl-D-alanine ligase [Vicinamibacterales bacterium]
MKDIALIASWVARAMDGQIVAGDPAHAFDSVSIDTRTLTPGALYIGIRGERFDGADFARAAIDAGAAGVVVPRGRSGARRGGPWSGPSAVIEVDDTTVALQSLAREVRRASGSNVVAITGSAGKTTTKEVAAEFLATRYRVIRNRGNLNNHIGLPLSLIDLRQRPDIAVVELGMNHAGEIRTLVGVAEPDVRVWTNVGEAHLGFFESEDAIADAKAEILEGARPETLLVSNADDDRVAARTKTFAGRVTTFGIDRAADVRAVALLDRGIEGIRARVTTPVGDVALESPLVGRSNLANVLAGVAVAIEFGVPLAAIAEKTAALKPAPRRGEVLKLSDVTVIDDSYNANPTATTRAIEILASTQAARRIAILGEMLELGDRSVALHEDVGRAAARARVDVLIAVGGVPAAALADAAVRAGLPHTSVHHFTTSEEAADAAAALVASGDLVLVKGSRGVRTDRVVDRLKAERG